MLSLLRGVQWCDIGWQTQVHIQRKEQGVWIEETRGEREEQLTVKAIEVSQLPLSRSLSELPCLFILSPTPSVTCLLIYLELILQLFCVRTRRCHAGYNLERTNGEKRKEDGCGGGPVVWEAEDSGAWITYIIRSYFKKQREVQKGKKKRGRSRRGIIIEV